MAVRLPRIRVARLCASRRAGASVARALFGPATSVGQTVLVGGDRYNVVGELAPRKGTFFGENRNDSVIAIPVTTARRKFPDARNLVLYIRAHPGQREQAREEARAIFRLIRHVPADADDNFSMNSADQIIAQFDRIGALIFLATIALSAVSLAIGGIGIANVMIISVTERTREIGVRLAIGARRRDVRRQFLVEATMLSGAGGVLGVAVAVAIGAVASLVAPGFPAAPPLWAVAAGLAMSASVGIAAGYLPARRAAAPRPGRGAAARVSGELLVDDFGQPPHVVDGRCHGNDQRHPDRHIDPARVIAEIVEQHHDDASHDENRGRCLAKR